MARAARRGSATSSWSSRSSSTGRTRRARPRAHRRSRPPTRIALVRLPHRTDPSRDRGAPGRRPAAVVVLVRRRAAAPPRPGRSRCSSSEARARRPRRHRGAPWSAVAHDAQLPRCRRGRRAPLRRTAARTRGSRRCSGSPPYETTTCWSSTWSSTVVRRVGPVRRAGPARIASAVVISTCSTVEPGSVTSGRCRSSSSTRKSRIRGVMHRVSRPAWAQLSQAWRAPSDASASRAAAASTWPGRNSNAVDLRSRRSRQRGEVMGTAVPAGRGDAWKARPRPLRSSSRLTHDRT